MELYKFKCQKCNRITSVNIDFLIPYSGKQVVINCANPTCGTPSRIQVPDYNAGLSVKGSSQNVELAPTEIPHINEKPAHFVKLKVLKNQKTEVQEFILKKRVQSVGRHSQAPNDFKPDIGIITSDRKISKNHFQITQIRNKAGETDVVIKDEQSRNGTFLNNNSLPIGHSDEIYLKHGDQLRIGDTLIEFEMF